MRYMLKGLSKGRKDKDRVVILPYLIDTKPFYSKGKLS